MHWFRKVLVAFFALILFIAVLDVAWTFAVNRNFSNPEQIKTWLTESKIYDNAVSAVLNSTQEDKDKTGSDGSISLKDPIVQKAAQEAFSPEVVKVSVNTFIDSNYAWLSGKTATPEFKIDLTQAKEDFATKVGTAVQTRLAGLTVCTAEQQAQLQIPVNVMTVTCRPATLDPATEGARIAQEIRSSDFLTNPVLTADTLARDPKSTAKPYYVTVAKAPQVYQAAQKAPAVLALIALISALLIIFIASPRRKGWRRIASVLLVAGILLIASKFAAELGVSRIQREAANSKSVISQLKQPTNDLVDHVASKLTETNLYFGIGYVTLAIIIYIVLRKTKEGSGKSKPKKPFVPPASLDDPKDDKKEATTKTAPLDTTGATGKPTGPPVFKNPKPTPVRKSPKPPRLVQ